MGSKRNEVQDSSTACGNQLREELTVHPNSKLNFLNEIRRRSLQLLPGRVIRSSAIPNSLKSQHAESADRCGGSRSRRCSRVPVDGSGGAMVRTHLHSWSRRHPADRTNL